MRTFAIDLLNVLEKCKDESLLITRIPRDLAYKRSVKKRRKVKLLQRSMNIYLKAVFYLRDNLNV